MSAQTQPLIRYLSKSAAQPLWLDLVTKEGIPVSSTTARCMFNKTQSSRGNQSQFGLTPLWDNVLRKNSQGEVLHSEFMDLARRLVDAGKTRQDPRR